MKYKIKMYQDKIEGKKNHIADMFLLWMSKINRDVDSNLFKSFSGSVCGLGTDGCTERSSRTAL